jgi:hypothetical protein
LWFTLTAPKLEMLIGLEEIRRVRIHEEIIPELFKKLESSIKSDGVAKHPVIVDSNTLVVLDGMHRVAALESLGCRYLPVCLVDYRSPSVEVRCWYRTVLGEVGQDEIDDILNSLGLEFVIKSQLEAVSALERREALMGILTRETCNLVKDKGKDVIEIYSWINRMEEALSGNGLGINYDTEVDAEQKVNSGGASAAVMTPRVKKDEVIKAALSGRVFAHKTTRHIMAARPMGVDVPLGWLSGERPLDDVNREMVEQLSKRKVKVLPQGSLFEGRRYEDELWVFE